MLKRTRQLSAGRLVSPSGIGWVGVQLDLPCPRERLAIDDIAIICLLQDRLRSNRVSVSDGLLSMWMTTLRCRIGSGNLLMVANASGANVEKDSNAPVEVTHDIAVAVVPGIDHRAQRRIVWQILIVGFVEKQRRAVPVDQTEQHRCRNVVGL